MAWAMDTDVLLRNAESEVRDPRFVDLDRGRPIFHPLPEMACPLADDIIRYHKEECCPYERSERQVVHVSLPVAAQLSVNNPAS